MHGSTSDTERRLSKASQALVHSDADNLPQIGCCLRATVAIVMVTRTMLLMVILLIAFRPQTVDSPAATAFGKAKAS